MHATAWRRFCRIRYVIQALSSDETPVHKHLATPRTSVLRSKASRKSWAIVLLEHHHRNLSAAIYGALQMWRHLSLPDCEYMQRDAGNFPLMADYYGDMCIKTRRQYLVHLP